MALGNSRRERKFRRDLARMYGQENEERRKNMPVPKPLPSLPWEKKPKP